MEPHQNPSLILICTTSYDEITCFLSRLLSDFSYAGKSVRHVRLERPDVSYQEIVAQYRGDHGRVVLIFCGHGEVDALLTGLRQDCSNLKEQYEEDVFYDSAHFDLGPDVLAAFCRCAGEELGPGFALATGGNFLGMCGELWLVPTDSEECNSWWKAILNGFIVRVIDDEKVDEETVNFVRSLYQEAYDYYRLGQGQSAEEALGMRMILRKGMSALCNH